MRVLAAIVMMMSAANAGDLSHLPSDLPLKTSVVAPQDHPLGSEHIWKRGPYCGANSVAMMLKLNGIDVSPQQLRESIPLGPHGASLLELKKAAEASGLPVEVVKATPDELQQFPLPLIAHVGDGPDAPGHFVLVCRMQDGAIRAIDGTTGKLLTVAEPLFRRAYSGFALVAPKAAARADRAKRIVQVVVVLECLALAGVLAWAKWKRKAG